MNAFNEGFFEHFSIENYLKMSPANSLKAFKQNLLKTMAVEGEEEGATEIGNIIGEMLIPGAVVNSRKVFSRLFERIEKCVQRGERIELKVTDLAMVERTVPTFWLIPAK